MGIKKWPKRYKKREIIPLLPHKNKHKIKNTNAHGTDTCHSTAITKTIYQRACNPIIPGLYDAKFPTEARAAKFIFHDGTGTVPSWFFDAVQARISADFLIFILY